jgi:hypothetical protein
MKEVDVLKGLLNGDPGMPSLGDLITIGKDNIQDIELLYEEELTADKKFGTGATLNDIAATIDDTDMEAAENKATMQFLKMEAMVTSICDMSANKRHGLILGDPGVGKCLSYDELITIRVDYENAKVIQSFLN